MDEVLRPATVAASRALLAEDLAGAVGRRSWPTTSPRAIDALPRRRPPALRAVHGAARRWGPAARGTGLGHRPAAAGRGAGGRGGRSTSAERCSIGSPTGLRAAGRDELDDLDDVERSEAMRRRARRAVRGLRVAGLRQRSHRAHAGRATGGHRAGDPRRAGGPIGAHTGRPARPSDAMREPVPEADRDRFDDLVADARAAYGANDDNTTVLFATAPGPGASRRPGGRSAARGAGPRRRARPRPRGQRAELAELAAGAGPSAAVLADRAAARIRARAVVPPPVIGSPSARGSAGARAEHRGAGRDARRVPAVAWRGEGTTERAVATVGDRVVRGRAVVATDPTDALMRIEPGDVLVVRHHHGVLQHGVPRAGGGGGAARRLMSHAAVLARELGLHRGDRRPGPARPGARR